jgi:hypothetical protein
MCFWVGLISLPLTVVQSISLCQRLWVCVVVLVIDLTSVSGVSNDEVSTDICNVLESICCVVGQPAVSSLSETLISLLNEIIAEPQTRSDKMIGRYFTVLARFMLTDFAFVTQLCSGEKTLANLIELWLTKFDSLEFLFQKKICSLALLKFVPTRDFAFLNKCGYILTYVTGVVYELREDIYRQQVEVSQDKSSWTETERREVMNLQDPVNSIKLRDALRGTMMNAESLHGEPGFQKILTDLVDPTILNQVLTLVQNQ